MSRYTGPKTRINRRFGQTIFPATKAFERKPHLPGIHGPKLRRKSTPFSVGLLAKQVGRFTYGLTEKQFYRTFQKAKRRKGITGDLFLQSLDMRLDSIVYQMGFSRTRAGARQAVNHGHIKVNGIKVDIPSYACKPGDKIEVRDKTASRQLIAGANQTSQGRPTPAWLSVFTDTLSGIINRLPSSEELDPTIDRQLIVEFYSR